MKEFPKLIKINDEYLNGTGGNSDNAKSYNEGRQAVLDHQPDKEELRKIIKDEVNMYELEVMDVQVDLLTEIIHKRLRPDLYEGE